MSQFIEVEITISQLVHDLRAGLTWLACQDNGHGSIQAKYEMEDEDVIAIQSHPAFHAPIRTFKIIDDYTKKPAVQPVAVVEEETVRPEPEPEPEPAVTHSVHVQPMRPESAGVDLFGNITSVADNEPDFDEVETEQDGALDFMSL